MTSKTKTILGISLAAIFAVTMIAPQAFANATGHLIIEDGSLVIEKNGQSQSVHFQTGELIPEFPAINFGWAVPTVDKNGDPKGFLVIATHDFIDSNAQSPPEESHTHFLTVKLDSDDCATGITPTFATKNEVGRLSIENNVEGDFSTIWVKNVPRGLAGDLTTGAFGFTLTNEDLNNDQTNSLCVNPVPSE